MNPMHTPPSYEEYTGGHPPSGSSLLEVEDGLTVNQRTRGRGSLTSGLGWFADRLWTHLGVLYVLWFVAFVIACCAMSQANKNKSDISSSSSSSSTSTSSSSDWVWTERCEYYGDLLYGIPTVEYEGHHYQIVGGNWAKITWRDAEQDAWWRCYQGKPGYLASINSQEENDFLVNELKNDHGYATDDQAWIGGNDMAEEGTFEWWDGYAAKTVFYGPGAKSGVYSNWQTGEPNNNGEEDCVGMNGHGYWNDDNCYKQKQYFVVEFDV
mmetsp:Transcript_8647/g.22038  ORF Transcript_8647/g.22038 Transcript_8647/m.22038 type:complete len:267 (-) Transcript_8647:248-1048(-)